MPAGRPAKPVEEKRRLGNPGQRPLPASSGTLALAPAPPIETTSALEVFERVMANGVVWLGETDTIALAQLRDMLTEREQLLEQVLRFNNEDARRALRELDKQVASRLAFLGFDPASRARLGLAEVKAKSKLEQIRQTRAADADVVVDG